MLSERMKKLFEKEREFQEDGLYDGRKATLDDVWITLNSFDADELEQISGGVSVEALESEVSRLRKEYGDNAELQTVKEKETWQH